MPTTDREPTKEELAAKALARAKELYEESGRVYIELLADRLDRAPHTLRQWLKRKDFPKPLRPAAEGGRNKLYWVDDQMPGLRDYAETRASLRGSFGRS